MCTNEGGKDFIGLYYRSTFNNAKPKFLSLQESNQQILVVNTSCVDSSIVFIDPISFSMLKKIQLRFADFETPPHIKKSINTLREIFDRIKKKQGKDPDFVFRETVDPETGDIKIRSFVDMIFQLDQTIAKHDLFKMCQQLDEDGSGSISLDEFIALFASEVEEADNLHDKERLLQDGIWPAWVVKEKKQPQVETLLSQIWRQLEQKYGLSAEAAFGIYDYKDTGLCTVDEFKRILSHMFSEEVPTQADQDLLLRLLPTASNDSRNYKELSKFLKKRIVRSFKYVQENKEGCDDSQALQSHRVKSPVEIELERPLNKEASLNYILRKAAELQIDLRKEFVTADPLELSVLPRVKMWTILINLPLGMNEKELTEVFENDLNFDNYGNVDYTNILFSDIFVTLEGRRLRDRALRIGKQLSKKLSNGDDS